MERYPSYDGGGSTRMSSTTAETTTTLPILTTMPLLYCIEYRLVCLSLSARRMIGFGIAINFTATSIELVRAQFRLQIE